jgi:uncharacterized protein (DUF1697 family)
MPRQVAFLRAINVGGRTVTMEELRRVFQSLGFKNVETFIASGNVIFTSPSRGTKTLSRRIEKRLLTTLGYQVDTFLRTDAEVAAVASYRPFKESRLRSAAALNVGFLAEPLPAAATRALMALRTPINDFHVNQREVYWLCKKKQSESTFSHTVFEKTLKVRATFRGMSTIERLTAKYGFSETAL